MQFCGIKISTNKCIIKGLFDFRNSQRKLQSKVLWNFGANLNVETMILIIYIVYLSKLKYTL